MNRIERQALEIIKTKMNLGEEMVKIRNLEKKTGKKINVEQWIKNWGTLDLDVVTKYSIKHGIPLVEFAKQWIELDGVEQLEIWKEVK